MSDTEALRVDTTGDVATITVDRPRKHNALNYRTLEALVAAVDEAEAADARVLVLTGAGEEAFVAGADIAAMAEFSTPEAQAYAELGHRAARKLETFPAPTVAAVNGYAFGGGMELALACDLRVAAQNAVFGQTELDLGIIPGWGGTQRLPRLVGDEVARRLIFFGERIDATDAHEYGLVGEVVAGDQLDDRVETLSAELAAQPRFALRAAKEALNAANEGSASAGLAHERRAFSGLFGTHDQREGMEAFVEKRDPEFE
ncbi:enoyl-CoA hydratase/isomerase family protein [Candidatus Halobonum tyrrellensis]|uniref:Enoyl-CoA hydratase n=1 Tax=Candidatus Halobonum tyrrellensis G22 TaxID=1324957 RepID=V4GRH0_9EURY|nr:enoyl-CoA hydratase-related protein [Candidatus Halobonum tyrrellensis]ESP87656.1 enoyl-CoA hydratase [Candidatus Halobonum tyrrellensis G22]